MPMMQHQPYPPQEENILQLSKQIMNTDSSKMLYPDFTHNLTNMTSNSLQAPLPIGIVENNVNNNNNSDYYDIAEIK